MTHTFFCGKKSVSSLLPLIMFSNLLFFSASTNAQGGTPAEKEETVICKLSVSNKIYDLKATKAGFFPQVSNVKPSTIVPITVTYPQGIADEKVVLAAEDGGRFDNNKSVMTVFLDAEKKCVFNFHLTKNDGLFDITLHKGNDAKTIQLWVGEE